jgi:hypothetical protein
LLRGARLGRRTLLLRGCGLRSGGRRFRPPGSPALPALTTPSPATATTIATPAPVTAGDRLVVAVYPALAVDVHQQLLRHALRREAVADEGLDLG